MKLALYSGTFSDIHSPWRYPVDEIARIISEAGYDGIELEVRHFDPNEANLDRQLEIIDTIKSYGLEIPALSGGQWYTVRNKAIREYRVELFNKLLRAAKRFGIPIVNNYTGGTIDFKGYPTGLSEKEAFKIAVDCLKRNCRVAEKLGIYIGLEAVVLFVAHDLKSTRNVLEAVNSPMLAITIDAANYAAYGLNPADVAKYWGDKIKWVHLKDIPFASAKYPIKWAPLGKGIINWNEFIKSLREIGYDGWLTIDYGGYRVGGETELEEIVKKEKEFLQNIIVRA